MATKKTKTPAVTAKAVEPVKEVAKPKGFSPDPEVLARKIAVGLSKAEALQIMETQYLHDGNQE